MDRETKEEFFKLFFDSPEGQVVFKRRYFMTKKKYDISKHRAWHKKTTKDVIEHLKLVLRSDRAHFTKKRDQKFLFKRKGEARPNALTELEKRVEKQLDFPLQYDRTTYLMYANSNTEVDIGSIEVRRPMRSD